MADTDKCPSHGHCHQQGTGNSLASSLLAAHFPPVAASRATPELSFKRRKLLDGAIMKGIKKVAKKSVRFCLDANMTHIIVPAKDMWTTRDEEQAFLLSAQVTVQSYRDSTNSCGCGGPTLACGDDQNDWKMRGLEHAVSAAYQEYKKRRGRRIRRAIVSSAHCKSSGAAEQLAHLAAALTADDCHQAKTLAAYDVAAAMCIYANCPAPLICPCTAANACMDAYSLFSQRRQPQRLTPSV